MTVGWLLDTSALARAHRPAVLAALRPMLRARVLYTCPLLELAAASAAGSADERRRLLADRREAYRHVPLKAEVGLRALALQARLDARASRRQPRAGDLLVAATAQVHGLGVLHYDPVFELLGSSCGVLERAVVPLGSLA